jgi:hypothetical protein
MSSLSSNLKQQIRQAIHDIYHLQGTEAAKVFSSSDEVAKALLDILFPEEVAHNTEVTGVALVPTLNQSDSESTDSKKERKKREPMSDEAKAQMKAKRDATIAAKKAAPAEREPEPGTTNAGAAHSGGGGGGGGPPAGDKKERKPRGPMSDEAKAAMKAKRDATIAAKKAAVE